MAIKILHKKCDGKKLAVAGHLSDKEINALLREGYRFKKPQFNKNGIRIET